MGALWPDQLTNGEITVLQRGVQPRVAATHPDVLVVGGGVVGVATALACLRAGLGSIMLLDRNRLGEGATGGAAGLLTPEVHEETDPASFVDLGRMSLSLWHELEAAWPGGVGLVELDWLGLEPHPPGFAGDRALGAERLNAHEVDRLAPGLARPAAGVLIRRQARVNPLRAVARLAARLPCVMTGVNVLAATIRGDRVLSLVTSVGEVSAGAVIFATGGRPGIQGLEFELPCKHVKGHLLATEPSLLRWPGIVAPLATQLEDGRLLVGGTLDTWDDSPGVRSEVISSVWTDLCDSLPTARELRISHRWCCFRPMHPDGLPVIDRVPGLANAWVTSGHYRTGILMAPVTGQVLANWISTNRQPSEITGLGLTRFDHR